jgi:energy-converting hydrogenase B subunit D
VIALQIIAFSAVMILGVLVVLSHDPLRQAIVNGVFGLSLVVLFVVLQAPDVALSELVVGTVAFPLVLLATIARTKGIERPE